MIKERDLSPKGSWFGLEDFRICSNHWDGWSFWGFSCGDCQCDTRRRDKCNKCKTLLWEFHHQQGRLARDDLRKAIRMAEDIALRCNQIPVGRRWFEQIVRLPRGTNGIVKRLTKHCRYPAVDLCMHCVRALGVPVYEEVATNVPVTYVSVGGGTAFEPADDPRRPYTFVATIDIDPLNPPNLENLQVHISEAYRECPIDNDTWIRPVKAEIDGGTLAITGRAWLMGNPLYWLDQPCDPPSCLEQGNFMATIDVYELNTNTEGITVADAGTVFLAERPPCGCGCCLPITLSTDPATITQTVGRGGIRNHRTGRAFPTFGVWDSVNQLWREDCCKCSNAGKVLFRFEAGMEKSCTGDYLAAITKISAGLLPSFCQKCCVDNSFLMHWATDLAAKNETTDEDSFNFTFRQLNHSIATTRGVIYGVEELKQHAVSRAIVF